MGDTEDKIIVDEDFKEIQDSEKKSYVKRYENII